MTEAVTTRRAQTRERLMVAAATVFGERGIIGASVEEICETADFTRGAFYSNFGSKDDLVLALLQREVERQFAAAQQAIEVVKHNSPSDKASGEILPLALDSYLAHGGFDRHWVLVQQELLLYAARRPEVRAQYLRFAEQYDDLFGALIAEGLQAAGLEFTLPADEAMALISGCHQQDQLAALLPTRLNTARRLQLILTLITRPAR